MSQKVDNLVDFYVRSSGFTEGNVYTKDGVGVETEIEWVDDNLCEAFLSL